jgi:hypothetical protein
MEKFLPVLYPRPGLLSSKRPPDVGSSLHAKKKLTCRMAYNSGILKGSPGRPCGATAAQII